MHSVLHVKSNVTCKPNYSKDAYFQVLHHNVQMLLSQHQVKQFGYIFAAQFFAIRPFGYEIRVNTGVTSDTYKRSRSSQVRKAIVMLENFIY